MFEIKLTKEFARIDPGDFAVYLQSHGWDRLPDVKGCQVWVKEVGGEVADVLLSLDRTCRLYLQRMGEAIATVSAVDDRPQFHVFFDLEQLRIRRLGLLVG